MSDAYSHRDAILALIRQQPGISDREIAAAIFGLGTPANIVNPMCRELADKGITKRRLRPDGLLGNLPHDHHEVLPPGTDGRHLDGRAPKPD